MYRGAELGSRDHEPRPILDVNDPIDINWTDSFAAGINATGIKCQFSKDIWEHKYDNEFKIAEYLYFDRVFGISADIPQREICIVGGQYNMLKQKDYT